MFNLGTHRKKEKDREKSISTPTIFAGPAKGAAAHKDVSSPVESVIKFSQGGGFVPGTPVGMPGSGDDVATFKEEDRIEIERRFEAFLTQLALPADKLTQMRSLPLEKKWGLLQSQKSKGADIPILHSPIAFVELLGQTLPAAELSKHLQSLEVSLRTEPIQWVKNYIAGGGLPILLNLMKGFCAMASPTKDDREALYHLTRSLRALMNNTHGLQTTLSHPDGIPTLTLLLYIWPTISIWKNKTIVLDLLSAICFVPPDGHLKILEALQGWRDEKGEGKRFEVLVSGLKLRREDAEGSEGDVSFHMEYQISCLTFINAIVNSPEDLEFRVSLRNEFIELGIIELLPPLRALDHDELNTQIQIFEEEAAADLDAFAEVINVESINMQDPDAVFTAIKAQLDGSESWNWFVRVLQGLCMAPCDPFRGPKLWELLHITVSQIVLQRNGLNPDLARLRLNVDSAIGWLGKDESRSNYSPIVSPLSATSSVETPVETTVSERVKMKQMEERIRELEKKERIMGELEEMVRKKDEELSGLRKEIGEIRLW